MDIWPPDHPKRCAAYERTAVPAVNVGSVTGVRAGTEVELQSVPQEASFHKDSSHSEDAVRQRVTTLY